MESRLGFDKLQKEVISTKLCTRCGACVTICPVKVLSMEKGEPEPIGECTNCGLCLRSCPRYKSPFVEAEQFIFGRQREPEENSGIYKKASVARSADDEILKTAQDGGVVTTLLASALESGHIDGAIVSKIDPENPWKPLPFFAKTRDELIGSAGTRYTLSTGLPLLKNSISAGYAKIGFVGTPCQILAARMIQKSLPKYGKCLALTVGLFCSEEFYYDTLMIKKIQNELGINLNDIEKLNIKGKFLIQMKNREVKDIPLKELTKLAMPSCNTCPDFSSELADISCGGVGLKGWTYTITRTDAGITVYEDAVKKGMILEEPVEKFSIPTKIMNKLSNEKRKRILNIK